MHKMNQKDKAKIGGRLARLFRLSVDNEGRYVLGVGPSRDAVGVFEIVHEAVVHKEYCEAVKKAVEALEMNVALADKAKTAGHPVSDNGECLRAAREALAGFKKEGK